MINFYRRFIPKAAHTQRILNALLKGNKKNSKRKVAWTEEAIAAFEASKSQLGRSALLAFPQPDAPLALVVDVSDFAIGAVVQQRIGEDWQPLAFYSVKLSSAQMKYSAYDRELLAVYSAIKHFRFLLEGRQFTVFTDHKPLTFAIQQNPEKASPRQVRHLDFIGQFTTDITHISGKDNLVADALSRIEALQIPSSVDFSAIAEAQVDDPKLEALLKNSSLKFKKIVLEECSMGLYCDTSTQNIRPCIPASWRKTVFNAVYNLSHPGARATVKLLTDRFF